MPNRRGRSAWLTRRCALLLLADCFFTSAACPAGGHRSDRRGGQIAGEGITQRRQLPDDDLLALLGTFLQRAAIILAIHSEGIAQRWDILIGHGGAT
jgi:hypothetical protein